MFETIETNLLKEINENTWIISDTHFNHNNILAFETKRLDEMVKDMPELKPLQQKMEDLTCEEGRKSELTDLLNILEPIHTQWMIGRWNTKVKKDDLVLHLGDFAWKGMQDVIPQLNGRKVLILGNHDRKGSQVYKDFEYVIRGLWLEVDFDENHYLKGASQDELFSVLIKNIDGKRVMLSHYPVDENEITFTRNEKMIKRIEVLKEMYYYYECEMNIHGHTHSNNMIDRDTRVFKNASFENIGFMPIKIKELIKK
jgi:calcineurin-like phosphoesterase family protein